MIETIAIENYRCFHQTQIENFRLINLIGGRNNVGKTALLEAMYLLAAPKAETLLNIGILRKEGLTKTQINPANLWDNFFYNYEKENEITLENGQDKVKLKYKQEEIFTKYEPNSWSAINLSDDVFAQGKETLTITKSKEDRNLRVAGFYINPNKNNKLYAFINGNEVEVFDYNETLLYQDTIDFLTSSDFRLSSEELVKLYSHARIKDKTAHKVLLEGFRCIDEKIELVESLSVRTPSLYLARENELTRPLKMYGDAMNRVAEFILRIINNANGLLLIDEIENGFHYTTQQKVWEIIFTLAIRHNVQVFATTHSLEMIKAYAKVAENYPEKTAYFEMYRSVRTGEIAASLHDIDLLKYELANNNEIRGEQ